ncbi:MAG: glycosyltransferase [Candidatus Paceibacterota bacterium]
MKSEQNIEIPLVTVVMSTYNETLQYVREAVESIFRQTCRGIVFIVTIDNIKNAEVVAYLESFAQNDKRLILQYNQAPQGLAFCRNRAIEAAQTEYVALMDADDISLSDRIEKEIEWMKKTGADLVFSHVEYINAEGESLGFFKPFIKKLSRDIFLRHLFVHPSGLIKRNVFEKNTYDTAFKRSQDLDLWLRLYKKGYKFSIVPNVLLQYRLLRSSNATDRIKKQAGYSHFGFAVARKHLKNFWHRPTYWYFLSKKTIYFALYKLLPDFLLQVILRTRDIILRR